MTEDLDELLRDIDRLVDAEDWDGLVDLRDRCRRALERGRQLWPAAANAEYRLALDAPGQWAASVLVPGAGQFALGPLPEVAASTHSWDELAPHAPPGPPASLAAHERVVRGEDLTGDDRVDPGVLELPLQLQEWEPAYPLAVYTPTETRHDDVAPPPMSSLEVRAETAVRAVDDADAGRALVDLAGAWTTGSNGRASAVAVKGGAPAAFAALGATSVRVASIDAGHALAHMAWAAASGGAHGRRRGMATGRFAAWWAVAAMAGLLDDWPVPPDDLGEAATSLRWYRWLPDDGSSVTGWSLHLAVEDPAEGLAWAVAATDFVALVPPDRGY